MGDYRTAQSQANAAYPSTVDKLSRLEADVEVTKRMTVRVETLKHRILRHAQTLGYWSPEPTDKSGLEPVITTLQDALQALDRAIDACEGALNYFD